MLIMFYKLILNALYGKFAQRKYDNYIYSMNYD